MYRRFRELAVPISHSSQNVYQNLMAVFIPEVFIFMDKAVESQISDYEFKSQITRRIRLQQYKPLSPTDGWENLLLPNWNLTCNPILMYFLWPVRSYSLTFCTRFVFLDPVLHRNPHRSFHVRARQVFFKTICGTFERFFDPAVSHFWNDMVQLVSTQLLIFITGLRPYKMRVAQCEVKWLFWRYVPVFLRGLRLCTP
jgi:hypothetical protein